MPVLQRQTSETPAAAAPSSPAATPPLGKASASTSRTPQRPSAPTPTQPADAPSPGPRGRTRGGIGTPLTSLPSTARVQRDAPLLGDRRRTQPGPSAAPAPQATPPQATPAAASTASPSTPSAMPVRSAAAPVQRAVDDERAHPRTPSGTVTGTGSGTATPAPRTSASPATPPAPVRIRNIGPRREGGQALATPSAGTAALTPTVQRSRTLLSGRDLKVNTGRPKGSRPHRRRQRVAARPARSWQPPGAATYSSPGTGVGRPGPVRRPPVHQEPAAHSRRTYEPVARGPATRRPGGAGRQRVRRPGAAHPAPVPPARLRRRPRRRQARCPAPPSSAPYTRPPRPGTPPPLKAADH